MRRRLFPHHPATTVDDDDATPFRIERILEEGDTEDLRSLFREVGEEAIRRWVEERAARRLSRRSLAFWGLLLEIEDPPRPAAIREALWPH